MSIYTYAFALSITVAIVACGAMALRCWVRQAGRKPTQPFDIWEP
jgi:hypothetical protein